MGIISLPSMIVVTILRFGAPYAFETPAGYYSNCVSLADSIRSSPLIISAECRVIESRAAQ
jgi:hypothetical protein